MNKNDNADKGNEEKQGESKKNMLPSNAPAASKAHIHTCTHMRELQIQYDVSGILYCIDIHNSQQLAISSEMFDSMLLVMLKKNPTNTPLFATYSFHIIPNYSGYRALFQILPIEYVYILQYGYDRELF